MNDNITLEIHKKLLTCTVGENLKINISDQEIKPPTYLVHGQIYHIDNDSMCVSCGGLLHKFPKFESLLGNKIYINIAKVSKRGRPPSNNSNKKQNKSS